MKKTWLAAYGTILLTCACTSVVTKEVKPGDWSKQRGLVYYMPISPYVVNVKLNVSKDKFGPAVQRGFGEFASASAKATAVIPDHSRAYDLQTSRGAFSKDTSEFQVSEAGLLSAVSANREVKLDELAKGIGEVAAQLTRGTSSDDCREDISYVVLSKRVADDPILFCNEQFRLSIAPLNGIQNSSTLIRELREKGYGGVFYRQSAPFIIKLESNLGRYKVGENGKLELNQDRSSNAAWTVVWQDLISSTTLSPDAFLPLASGLFADVESKITLQDGMLKSVKSTTEAEAPALLNFPAKIVSAYSTALIGGFTRRGNEAKAESDFRASQAELQTTTELRVQAAELKMRLCREALATGDSAKIKDACS